MLRNSPSQFGTITKTFHWLTALVIILAFAVGLIAQELPFANSAELARKATAFSLHKTLGVTAFFIALARILWALSQPRPGLLNADNRAEAFMAELVHWLLYGSMFLVPLTGWIHHAASEGFAPIWWPFGQNLPLVAKSESLSHFFSALHQMLTNVLGLAILLHVAGALKHAVLDRDGTLSRMWFGTWSGQVPPQDGAHGFVAPIVASAILAAALSIGGYAGLSQPHDDDDDAPAPVTTTTTQPPATATQDVAQQPGDWVVQSGEIQLVVNQLGSPVTGRFADWTARIVFDETPRDGVHGETEVQIDITSLTLGSVSDQAKGPEFFDTATFPTARFAATLVAGDAPDAYVADGTLTIRDQSVPVTLPFTLTIAGDDATAQGQLTLDRRDFGIGTAYGDESSVGFGVDVTIALSARRSAP